MNTRAPRFFATLLLLLACTTMGAAQTQQDLNREADREYKKADAELNRIYQQVLQEHRDDQVFITKLKQAQRAWLAYRDAEVEALYPAADKEVNYGSVFPLCYAQALTRLTTERTRQLKRWLSSTDETDICGIR